MLRTFFALVATLALSGSALAQKEPGDAAFCHRYATVAATAAQDAIALNSACENTSRGVHGFADMHEQWCLHTARDSAIGAATAIRKLASGCTKGALAMPQEYGGFDVVGNEKFERPYGKVRNWDVNVAFSGRTFMYCVAVLKTGADIRLGADYDSLEQAGQWQLAFPIAPPAKEWTGRMEIDGHGAFDHGSFEAAGRASHGSSMFWLQLGDLEPLRKGHNAKISLAQTTIDFSLDGLAAAITKIDECRSRLGGYRP